MISSAARRAFTLVEVLVVIAITALLSSVIITYSSTSRDQVALSVEQARLAQTIIKAKSLTVSTYDQPKIPCGYGVHFDRAAGTYELFSYDPGTCKGITTLDPLAMTEVATNHLPANLQFPTPDIQSVSDILFLPPNPDTWIWLVGQSSTSTQGTINVAAKSGKSASSISVNSAGQVTF